MRGGIRILNGKSNNNPDKNQTIIENWCLNFFVLSAGLFQLIFDTTESNKPLLNNRDGV